MKLVTNPTLSTAAETALLTHDLKTLDATITAKVSQLASFTKKSPCGQMRRQKYLRSQKRRSYETNNRVDNGNAPGLHAFSRLRKSNLRVTRLRNQNLSAKLPTPQDESGSEAASEEGRAFQKVKACKGAPKVVGGRETKEAIPPRTITEEQEDEIMRILEREQRRLLQLDPMKELEEALMDRTTAS